MRILSLFAASLSMVAARGASQAAPPACRVVASGGQLAQRASPLDSAVVELGGAAAKVCYGRPSARGRVIMGGLVPFKEPWRLGANEATTIYVPFVAEIGGVRVQPGTYSLYAIPSDSTWQIVVNRNAARWGIPIDSSVRAQDMGVDTVRAEPVGGKDVETLTLRFAPPKGGTTELIMEWVKTRVRIPVRRVGA